MSFDLQSVAEKEGSRRTAMKRPGLICHRLPVPLSKSLNLPVPAICRDNSFSLAYSSVRIKTLKGLGPIARGVKSTLDG